MSKQYLDKKTLDTIGRRLIRHDRVPTADIEKIISNPDLFTLVNARIETNARSRATGAGTSLPLVRRHMVAFAGSAMLLFAAIGAASFFISERPLMTAVDLEIPGSAPVVARFDVPPMPVVGKLPPDRASISDIRVATSLAKPVVSRAARVSKADAPREPEGDFYALSFAGDQEEAVTGGRIVRVDVQRSSLFALGANIPLENESEVVKADLLIGSDGRTRGIRIVK